MSLFSALPDRQDTGLDLRYIKRRAARRQLWLFAFLYTVVMLAIGFFGIFGVHPQ